MKSLIRGLPPLTAAGWLRFDSIRRGLRQANPQSVLEVGTGEGALATWLARRYRYDGLEPDSEARGVAEERLSHLGRGRVSAHTTEDVEARYALVCGFEVLEHIEDDVAELGRWRELLHPQGFVLLSVPAHRSRFGRSDRAVGHYRRYDRVDLEEVLGRAGLDMLWMDSWGFGLGHALEWLRHRLASKLQTDGIEKATSRSGRWLQPRGAVISLLFAAIAAPFRLIQRPFRRSGMGIGWVALARSVESLESTREGETENA